MGGKAVAAMKRKNNGDFRANIELGGVGEKYIPSSEQVELSERICRLLGADYIGVDLLFDKDKTLLCEVNTNAHFMFISDCTGVGCCKTLCRARNGGDLWTGRLSAESRIF